MDVLTCLVSIIQSLAGSSDKVFQPDNGNFLKKVELLPKYDTILQNHKTIVKQVRDSKYYSIILDCTPDISHQEHLSIIPRIVALQGKPEIKAHFLDFVNAEVTTGLNLFTVILEG